MKIAVAGSDGFVGRNVCQQLKNKGYEFIPIDISNGLDLCDSKIIEDIESIDCFIDIIFFWSNKSKVTSESLKK